MCLYPKLITNRKYTANSKNGGHIPPVPDPRVRYVPIGCGKCIECRKQKARQWQVRLLEDVRHNKQGVFVTLTMNNESYASLATEIKGVSGYDLDNEIATLAVRRFLERWRKQHKRSVRHWLVSELGHQGQENIHLHGIIWTTDTEEIRKHWKYGYVWCGYDGGKEKTYISERTVTYITKYISKTDEKHKEYKSIVLTSPGIGKGYLARLDAKRNVFNHDATRQTYKTRTGHEIALPIYYRNHLWTEEEREKLWLHMLDKQERWILGQKVDISTEEGYKIYFALLEDARTKNKKLGYGDDTVNWERKRYEQEKRNLKIKERIAKGTRKKSL